MKLQLLSFLVSASLFLGACGGKKSSVPWYLLLFLSPSQPTIDGIFIKDSNGNRYPTGSTLSLGSVLASSSGSPITLTLENGGSSSVNLTGTPNVIRSGVYASDYSNTVLSGSILDPGDSDSFQVIFEPGSEGVKSAYLMIPSDDPNVGTYILYLTGTGTAAPAPTIEVSESSTRFASGISQLKFYSTVSETSSRSITIKNAGTLPLNISGISLSTGTEFGSSGTSLGSFTLSPNQTRNISVHFIPPGAGPYSDTLQIQSNDPNIATFSLSLAGKGTAGPVPQISVTYLDNNGIERDISSSSGFSYSFGSILPGSSSGSKSITIRNLGTADLDLSGATVVLSTGTDFTRTSPGVSNLAPNASTTFTVKFSPTSVGSKNDTVTLTTSSGDGGSISTSSLGLTGAGGQRDIIATWAISKEAAVHRSSGGYRVCYKLGSTFSAEGGGVTCSDVPYSSGSYAPNFKVITVQSAGTWYVRVRSFSEYNSGGSGFSSAMSAVVGAQGN